MTERFEIWLTDCIVQIYGAHCIWQSGRSEPKIYFPVHPHIDHGGWERMIHSGRRVLILYSLVHCMTVITFPPTSFSTGDAEDSRL
jgi:hypothetical protein